MLCNRCLLHVPSNVFMLCNRCLLHVPVCTYICVRLLWGEGGGGGGLYNKRSTQCVYVKSLKVRIHCHI